PALRLTPASACDRSPSSEPPAWAPSRLSRLLRQVRSYIAPRHGPLRNVLEKAAMPERNDFRSLQALAREEAREHPIDDVRLAAAGAARRAEHRHRSQVRQEQEVAGVDGSAEGDDLASGLLDRARRDVVAVHDRGLAGQDHESRARSDLS